MNNHNLFIGHISANPHAYADTKVVSSHIGLTLRGVFRGREGVLNGLPLLTPHCNEVGTRHHPVVSAAGGARNCSTVDEGGE